MKTLVAIAILCITSCFTEDLDPSTGIKKSSESTHEEEVSVAEGNNKVVVPVRDEQKATHGNEAVEGAVEKDAKQQSGDASAPKLSALPTGNSDEPPKEDIHIEMPEEGMKHDAPDIFASSGIDKSKIASMIFEEEETDSIIRRVVTIKYKTEEGRPKYQVDVWYQTLRKNSAVWSTVLMERRFLKQSNPPPPVQDKIVESIEYGADELPPTDNVQWVDPETPGPADPSVQESRAPSEQSPEPAGGEYDLKGEVEEEADQDESYEGERADQDENSGKELAKEDGDAEEEEEEGFDLADLEEQPKVEIDEKNLTPEQLEARELYDEAQKLLTTGTVSSSKRAYQLLVGASLLNHTESRELVAFSYLFGDYLNRNTTRAVQMFEELNIEGNPRGQLGLGIIHAAGIQVNSSQAKALIYFTFSALGGDELAQMILGYRHLSGVGVQSSCETALIYYGKAARKVVDQVSMTGGPVVQRIRLYDESEASTTSISSVLDDDLIQYYQFLADKGDTSAQVGLGQLYYQGGRGVTVDYDLAFYYFMQASKGGDAMADAYIGRMYAEGVGNVERNYETAFEYFSKSAEQENPIGQCGLGMLYLKGHYVEKDVHKAFRYFQKSAEKNWVDGQLQLGLMYFKGEGAAKDHKSALKYFNLASQSGNVLALYNLAQMHASGMGVMRACHTAVELYKNVAERGPWSKLLMEGFDFYKRGYVDVALLKYLVAAELGYEVAQSNVGHILDTGESDAYESSEKYKRALLQWTRAAGQGSAVARIKLGDYHYYGLGTDVDYEQAIQHYRVAGEQQSNAQAMYNLAYMHEAGLGLTQDLHLAKRFYDMAAETSKDAYIPVTLALARLNLLSQLDLFTQTNGIWSLLSSLHPQLYFGPSWDMYLITILGMVFGLIVMLRTHILRPVQPLII